MVKALAGLSCLFVSVATVMALSGCGGSSGSKSNGEPAKTPNQVAADAQAAAAAAKSVHVSGSIDTGDSKITLDLHMSTPAAEGSMTVNGQHFDLIRIGDTAYFKASAATWRHFGGAAAAQLLTGRWLKSPANRGQLAALSSISDPVKLFNALFVGHGALKLDGESTVNGQAAVRVTDTTKGGSLYVATTGSPYPVELAKAGSGKISFDSWNATVAPAAPADPVDVSKLLGG